MPENMQVIKSSPVPGNIKQIQSFLGLVSYLWRFVPSFAAIASPLTGLLRIVCKFEWAPEQRTLFETLQRKYSSAALSHFQEDWQSEGHTDASKVDVGAVLMQRDHFRVKYIVAYASRKLLDVQWKYHSNELECLAVVWRLDENFCYYLYGRHFTIVNKNAAIRPYHE